MSMSQELPEVSTWLNDTPRFTACASAMPSAPDWLTRPIARHADLFGDALRPTGFGIARGKDDRTPHPSDDAFADDRFDRLARGRDQRAIDRLRHRADARVTSQLADLRIARVDRIDPAAIAAEIAQDRRAERAGPRRGADDGDAGRVQQS